MEGLIYLPYADWLSAQDRFEEAQDAYKKAKRPDLSLKIIEFLANNAIVEKRFQDAAQYYWMLAAESLQMVKKLDGQSSKEDVMAFKNYGEYIKLSEVYQAYNLVYKFTEESYGAMTQGALYTEAIFNSARFLVNNMPAKSPLGVSKVSIFFALATLGFKFENYKTSRYGYEQLGNLKVPATWQEEIEVDHLKLKSKPFDDKEEYSWACNRCMNINPLINPAGDSCVHCG